MGKSSLVVPSCFLENGTLFDEKNKTYFECSCGAVRVLPDDKNRLSNAMRHVKACIGNIITKPEDIPHFSVFTFEEVNVVDCEFWTNAEIEPPVFSFAFTKPSWKWMFCIGFLVGVFFPYIQ